MDGYSNLLFPDLGIPRWISNPVLFSKFLWPHVKSSPVRDLIRRIDPFLFGLCVRGSDLIGQYYFWILELEFQLSRYGIIGALFVSLSRFQYKFSKI
jgi:hypothetical protein